MSLRSSIQKKPQVKWDGARLRRAQARVSVGAQRAAKKLGPAVSQARETTSHRVMDAREWSAPRIEQAAKYVEKELGPKVGSMLHRTAGLVEPPRPRRRRGMLAATMLVGAGAAGAVGAAVSRRGAAKQESTEPSSPTDLSSVSENSSAERARSS